MLGYRVSLDDGSVRTVEASGYKVDDDGSLTLTADGQVVAVIPPGGWISVDEFGTRLAGQWPPSNLANVLNNLAHVLAVNYGHVTWPRGSEATYASEVFNEVDSLAGAVLVSLGIDPASTDRVDLRMITEVRKGTAEAFDRRVPFGRLTPSERITALYCPRCGDRLHADPRFLRCPTGNMDLSKRVTEALHDYRQTPPQQGPQVDSSYNWGGTWFCPDDGSRLNLSTGQLPNCGFCQRILPHHLMYQLVEFHVHTTA